MALTDEQRAMLQLLLEGGQGYDDIGSLLGIAPEDVRSRARDALREIGGADPDAQVGLSDYLLGQADPIGRADAIRHLQSDPEANALAQRLAQNLRLLAPSSQLPEIPAARGGRRAAAPAAPPAPPAPSIPPAPTAPAPVSPTGPSGPGLSSRISGVFSGLGGLSGKRRTQFLVGLVASLALIIVVVLVASSGGSSKKDCGPLNTSTAQQAGIPTMKLSAAGAAANADCPPSGQVTLASGGQPQSKSQFPTFVLQANAVHLPPTGSGERYLLWLYKSDSQSVPIGQETVDPSGNLTGQLPIPAQELILIPAFQTLKFSKVTTAEAQQVQSSLQSQGKKPTLLTQFVGEPVLQGNISDLGLQQLLQQAQAQAQSGSSGQAQQGAGKGTKG